MENQTAGIQNLAMKNELLVNVMSSCQAKKM